MCNSIWLPNAHQIKTSFKPWDKNVLTLPGTEMRKTFLGVGGSTASEMPMLAFWAVTPCGLEGGY
jgi:hypothetical protein